MHGSGSMSGRRLQTEKKRPKKNHPEPSCVFSAGLSKGGCPEEAFQESHAAQNVLLGKLQMISFVICSSSDQIQEFHMLIRSLTIQHYLEY